VSQSCCCWVYRFFFLVSNDPRSCGHKRNVLPRDDAVSDGCGTRKKERDRMRDRDREMRINMYTVLNTVHVRVRAHVYSVQLRERACANSGSMQQQSAPLYCYNIVCTISYYYYTVVRTVYTVEWQTTRRHYRSGSEWSTNGYHYVKLCRLATRKIGIDSRSLRLRFIRRCRRRPRTPTSRHVTIANIRPCFATFISDTFSNFVSSLLLC
jgi:hypothetical protein